MLNKFILTLALCCIPLLVLADEVTVKADHPEKYVVVKGDTLWDISGRFLEEPWLWPQVWEANPQIENPHLIYPGDVVSLQYQDGRPILVVNARRGSTSSRYVRLSPEVRSYTKDDAIPAIPVDAIKQFLLRPQIVSKHEMEEWPYIVSSYDGHLVTGSGNKIYIRGLPDDTSETRYAVYRQGKALINPRKDKDEILGYEAMYIGDAVIEDFGDPATAIVARSNREVLNGDRLAEENEADVNISFIPQLPVRDVRGNILSVIDGVSEIGQYQVVVVDIGTQDGMEVGNVLGVYKSGKIVKDKIPTEIRAREEAKERIVLEHEDTSGFVKWMSDLLNDLRDVKNDFSSEYGDYFGKPNAKPELVELPEEYAGVLMLFRTFDNLSYALVMEAVSPIHLYDTVQNL